MKKVYTMFKLFVATVLISFAGKANAQVTADDLVGTYKFTATLTINDDSYKALLTDEFTFKIANNSGIQITGFIAESQSCYAQLSDGQLVFNQQYMDANGTITLSNVNGDYPYGNPPVLPTWNVDDKGNITIPDFTVITSFNHQEQTAVIAAKYTDCKVTKQAATEEEKVNFTGTYTVTGTKFDYTNGMPPTSDEQATFTLSIDEDGNVYEIAGYEVPDVYGAQGVYGKISENSFVISPVVNSSLSLGMVFDKLGDDDAYTYNDEGSIKLNYSNGEWTMSVFSVWQFDWSTSEYTLKYYWTGLTVTKTSDTVSISSIAPEATAKANDGKFIENGKIVIVRNGVKYNVNGVAIK